MQNQTGARKFVRLIVIALAIAFLAVAARGAWRFYRYHQHLLAVAGVDSFVFQYVDSMKSGTEFYRQHSCDVLGCGGAQADLAKEIQSRYQLPYSMVSKAISGGPRWLYDTAFQIELRFENGERLYLHVRSVQGDYQVNVVPITTEPGPRVWMDGRE